MGESAPPITDRSFYMAIECYRAGEEPCLEVSFPMIQVDLKITPIPLYEDREQIILEQLRLYREQHELMLGTQDRVAGLL